MKVESTSLPGVLSIEPVAFPDERGCFVEAFHETRYRELGIPAVVQLNHNHSRAGVIRGLHYQQPNPQGKLVWFSHGTAFDVVVDVRRGSPTFGRFETFELSESNRRQIWIPAGYAHGFAALSETADCFYACTAPYAPGCDRSVVWNDPELGIEWPVDQPILSEKDRVAPRLEDAEHLPTYHGD